MQTVTKHRPHHLSIVGYQGTRDVTPRKINLDFVADKIVKQRDSESGDYQGWIDKYKPMGNLQGKETGHL